MEKDCQLHSRLSGAQKMEDHKFQARKALWVRGPLLVFSTAEHQQGNCV